jgi:hypothetical protein
MVRSINVFMALVGLIALAPEVLAQSAGQPASPLVIRVLSAEGDRVVVTVHNSAAMPTHVGTMCLKVYDKNCRLLGTFVVSVPTLRAGETYRGEIVTTGLRLDPAGVILMIEHDGARLFFRCPRAPRAM